MYKNTMMVIMSSAGQSGQPLSQLLTMKAFV